MDQFKKGGKSGNSNLYATNRLFVKNKLFKKRKKKASGVYDPNAKYKYPNGGPTDPPQSFYEYALAERQRLMSMPEAWQGDPDFENPDGTFNLCIDCLNPNYENEQDLRDMTRLIEEGYTREIPHYGKDLYMAGITKYNIPMPVPGSKVVKPTEEPKQYKSGGASPGGPKILTPEQQAYIKAKKDAANKVVQAAKSGNRDSYERLLKEFQAKYPNESFTCPSNNCPSADQLKPQPKPVVKQEAPKPVPVREVMQPMPTFHPKRVNPELKKFVYPETEPEGTDVMPVYDETDIEIGTPGPGGHWEDKTSRYIDWDGNSIGFNGIRFRKPGHGGDLIKKGGRHYIHYPSIEKRYDAWIEPDEYQDGGEPGDKFKQRLMKRYPGMQDVYGAKGENLNIVKDPNYDARSVGYGDIEFQFPEGNPEIRYPNLLEKDGPEYVYPNPSPNTYLALYNPRGANRGDVFLDMMHGMRDDPNYLPLLQNFEKAVRDARGGDMGYYYDEQVKKGYKGGQEQWDANYLDGQLRAQLAPGTIGMFSHGRRDYRKERKYDSPEMRAAAEDIRNYLKGEYEDGGEFIEIELGPEEIQDYINNGYIVEETNKYDDGGPIYTFPGRPGSQYKKQGDKWYISNSDTNNQFIPIKDPDGKRSAALNKGAVLQAPAAPQQPRGVQSGPSPGLLPGQAKAELSTATKAAPTVENAQKIKTLQTQAKKDDEFAARVKEKEEAERQQMLLDRQVGKESTNVVQPIITDGPKTFDPIAEQKAREKELTKLLATGDAAKLLGAEYLQQAGTADGISMRDMLNQRLVNNPNQFYADLEEAKYQDFLNKEQKAYDNMAWYDKGINELGNFIADPVHTGATWLGGNRTLINQAAGVRDFENPNVDNYHKATGYEDDYANKMFNWINPGASGADANVHYRQGSPLAALDMAAAIFKAKVASQGLKATSQEIGSYLKQPILGTGVTGNQLLKGYSAYEGATKYLPRAYNSYDKFFNTNDGTYADLGEGIYNTLKLGTSILPYTKYNDANLYPKINTAKTVFGFGDSSVKGVTDFEGAEDQLKAIEKVNKFTDQLKKIKGPVPFPIRKKGGSVETDLTQDQIQDLIAQGYVIEQV